MTRIGVVVPSVNTVVEPWFASCVPPDVTVHAARMLLADDLSAAAVVDMDRAEGLRAVGQLVSCRADAIAYCCTASSVLQGVVYDTQLTRAIEDAAGVPATTVTGALLAACRALGVGKVAIGSPYAEAIDDAERRFFTEAGLEVLSSRGLGITDSFGLAAPEPQEIYELGRAVCDPAADALILTCANFRSHEVVAALEADLGRPVLTSTQATLWRVLGLAGVQAPLEGYGRLFALPST